MAHLRQETTISNGKCQCLKLDDQEWLFWVLADVSVDEDCIWQPFGITIQKIYNIAVLAVAGMPHVL